MSMRAIRKVDAICQKNYNKVNNIVEHKPLFCLFVNIQLIDLFHPCLCVAARRQVSQDFRF